jgi:5-formyltetrahydrofolate cyclo-ligase
MYELRKMKTEIRNRLIEERKAIPDAEKELCDKKIAEYLLSSVSYRYSQAILCYCSAPNEVCTDEIIAASLKSGRIVACPVCDTGSTTISFKIIKSAGDLVSGAFGIREPSPECEDYGAYAAKRNAENGRPLLAVCIVPTLAFDKEGYRIGYGKGYYDRYLPGFDGAKIGLCHSRFCMPSLPYGKFDVKLDVCITETGVMGLSK